MKKFIICMFVAVLALSVSALTYDEGFDVDENWTSDGNMTSYTPKAYTNSEAGAIGVFSTDDAVRETAATQAGAYAWRLDDDDDYWRYQVNEGVVSFSVYTADWDVSDNNSFQIRYSTDSGATYTALLTTNASYYSGDKVYEQFVSGALNISPDSGKEIYIEVANNQGDIERILIDTFSVTTIPEPLFLGILPLAFLLFRRK